MTHKLNAPIPVKQDTALIKFLRIFNRNLAGIAVGNTVHVSSHIFARTERVGRQIYDETGRVLMIFVVNNPGGTTFADFIIEHEKAHVRQFQRQPWTFHLLYIWQFLVQMFSIWKRQAQRDAFYGRWYLRWSAYMNQLAKMPKEILRPAYKSMPFERMADMDAVANAGPKVPF